MRMITLSVTGKETGRVSYGSYIEDTPKHRDELEIDLMMLRSNPTSGFVYQIVERGGANNE